MRRCNMVDQEHCFRLDMQDVQRYPVSLLINEL